MTDLAAKIADRIRNNRHDARCGSYLLASEAGQVYVLREQGVSVTRMVQERAAWLVGFYAGDTVERRVRCPSSDEIADDLAQHFDDLAGARG
ncbi:hypothetical protein [Lysobacter sp. CA199]|uniref:hypothetical protein n=1 Tax=Lysobacter sp. CA199 TaxID=3455608 RepID=UPI003F8D20F3